MSPCTHNSRRITLRQNVRNNINMKANKNLYRITGKIAALLSCLLLFSCNSDDMLDEIGANGAGKYRDNICFGITSDESVQTKGNKPADNGYTSDSFVLRSENSDDTLCVNAIVTDGIESSDSVKKHAMTRGAAVTQDDFYDKFHVLAYWKKDGTSTGQFYMNTDVTDKGNNLWSSDRTYIWPGKAHTLTFYAWAPADAGITSPSSPESTTLEYTVPTTVTDQKDVVVATTEEIAGNANTTQPLAFRHICTAVKFKVGDQMQAGTIKKITISGVHNSGAYDMASDSWQLGSNTTAFSIEQDIEMTGNESGSMITDGENTFMMLPQELPAGAKVEIIFHDSQAGTDRTFSASIGGMTWPQGKTVTYTLSITPEYELEFISEPELQDAHYIIYPIHIKAGDVPGGWTITSSDPDNVTLRTDLTILTRRGFWIEEDKGTASIRSTAQGDDITIYAFLTENAGEENRKITLEMRPTNLPDAAPQTFTIEQLCPSWNGNLGCERIEEYDEGFTGYPWGFKWPQDMKITYNMENAGLVDLIKNALLNAYLSWFTDYNDFITKKTFLLSITSVTINFDAVPQVRVATSESDGAKNTSELYNYNGINDVSTLMSVLEDWGGTTTDVLPVNPEAFAARACAMKNKFHKTIEENMGQTIEIPVLEEEDLVWYLPARNQAPDMKDEQYPLQGVYWTSTNADVEGDNEEAYKYIVGGATVLEQRDVNLHVRAVRSK
jgi:hypothetical protein